MVPDPELGVDEGEWLLQPTADTPASVVTTAAVAITVTGVLIEPRSFTSGNGNGNPANPESRSYSGRRSVDAVCRSATVFVRLRHLRLGFESYFDEPGSVLVAREPRRRGGLIRQNRCGVVESAAACAEIAALS